MTTVESVKTMLKELKMYYISDKLDDLITKSLDKDLSYEKFLKDLLQYEIRSRDKKRFEKRMKMASFPEYKSLDEFDISEQQSLSQRQLNQLKELTWIEQGYNLVLLGPPGVGNYAKYLLM